MSITELPKDSLTMDIVEVLCDRIFEKRRERYPGTAMAWKSWAAYAADPANAESVKDWRLNTQDALSALADAGWVVVPREPTEDMLIDGHGETPYCHASPEECRAILGDRTCHEGIRDVWDAMLSAAQPASKE